MIRRIVREIRRRLPGNAGISRAVPRRAAALGLVRFEPAPGGAADLRSRDGSRIPRLLRLEPQWLRRGDRRWRRALAALTPLHDEYAVLFDGFVEASIATGREGPVHREPWVGVLHGELLSLDRLLADERWVASAIHCKGVFVFQEEQQKALAEGFGFPVSRLERPGDPQAFARAVAASEVYRALRPTCVDHFVLFAHRRSGSVTLELILAAHPDIRTLGEPFNPWMRKFKYSYLSEVRDPESLDRCLDAIFFYYTGIRHLMRDQPWEARVRPWPVEMLNRRLLARPLRRILLFRRNRLQAVVSEQMSLQTWIWQRDEGAIERPLEPFDLEDLAQRMEWLREDVEQYRRFLAENDLDFHEVAYEDLFGPDVAPEARIARVREIFSYLGAAEPDAAAWRRIGEHLDPARSKLNSEATYRLIPNAVAIEASLGSDDAGHLLETRGFDAPPSAS